MNTDSLFYDKLAPLYHLIFPDWAASMERQGKQLAALIEQHWPASRTVLDVACGIGTQALALAQRHFRVTASDLSSVAIDRARREAAKRELHLHLSVCDMRQVFTHHGGGFEIVVCADNSLPHLLTDEQMLEALKQMHACLKPGGGCVITVRDYDSEPRENHIVKPYGVRVEESRRYLLFQVWDFDNQYCHITFFIVEEDLNSRQVTTHVVRSTCYAVSTTVLLHLMRKAGFKRVERLDGKFYQPVLIGTRSS